MTIARLFTYWVATALIGSVLAPLILSLISSGGGGIGMLDVILISIIASMICSLPAMLTFYLVLTFQIDHKVPEARKQRILMWTHLSCGFLTFFVLGALIGFEILSALIVFFVIYTGIGMLFWFYDFKKQADKVVMNDEGNNMTEKTSESF